MMMGSEQRAPRSSYTSVVEAARRKAMEIQTVAKTLPGGHQSGRLRSSKPLRPLRQRRRRLRSRANGGTVHVG